MSSDLVRLVGSTSIAVAIIVSAGLICYVLIEMLGGVRAELRTLRDSLERAACGELARREGVTLAGLQPPAAPPETSGAGQARPAFVAAAPAPTPGGAAAPGASVTRPIIFRSKAPRPVNHQQGGGATAREGEPRCHCA